MSAQRSRKLGCEGNPEAAADTIQVSASSQFAGNSANWEWAFARLPL
jgi:hypothetical protein